MKTLIVEDNPERIKFFKSSMIASSSEAHFAVDADTAIDYLSNNEYEFIFLDHDLGGEENVETTEHNTGSTVVKYMVDNKCNTSAGIVIHSLNEPAAISMEKTLHENGFEAARINFLQLKNGH